MKVISTLAAAVITTGFFADVALSQSTITSSYRSVWANNVYYDLKDEKNPIYESTTDLVESTDVGAFNETASVSSSTRAELTSFVGPGLIEGNAFVDASNGYTVGSVSDRSDSRVEMAIEFTIDAETPFAFDIVYDSNSTSGDDLLVVTLASDSLSIVDIGGNIFNPGSLSLDGVLQPGDYSFYASVQPDEYPMGLSNYISVPASFDFSLRLGVIPSPSAAMCIAMPLAGVGFRRRC